MSTNNGQPADETTFNNAYLSRLSDSDTIGKIDLANAGSANITDVQLTINNQRTDIDQNRTDIDTNDTELANHESRISINETDIAAIQGDYVDLDTNQTIVGEKTFSNNAVFNGDLTVNGTTTTVNSATLDVTDKNITVNNGGSDATSEGAGLTVERVGTDGSLVYEDALDNKFKLGALGSEEEISAIVKDTLVNLQALVSPSSSNLYFSTDTLEHFRSDGTSLQPLGSGGGTGGLDTFHTESFETTVAADWSTGNSATFLTVGGGLVGTLSDETTSPIAGDSSLKYVSAAVSINDWFASPTYDLDLKQRGNDIGINFYFTLPTDSTYEVVFWDVTNSAKLNSELDIVVQSDGRTRYSASVFIPDTCTQYKYGFHSIIENGVGHTLIVDDFEFSTSPYVFKNLVELTDWETYTLTIGATTTAPTKGTTSYDNARWRRVGDSMEIHYEFKQTVAGTVGSGTYLFPLPSGYSIDTDKLTTSNGPQTTVGHAWVSNVAAADADASRIGTVSPYDSSNLTVHTVSTSDTPAPVSNSAFGLDATNIIYSFRATVPITNWSSSSEHVITPSKSNMSDWALYTPTYSAGLGSVGSIEMKYRRVGDTMEVQGRWLNGTTVGSVATVSLPSGYTVDPVILPQVELVGEWSCTNPAATPGNVNANGGDNFFSFASSSAGVNGIASLNGNAVFGSSSVTSVFLRVPIAEWSSDAIFLAAVPIQKVAYINTDPVIYTKDIASSTAYKTRTLSSVAGDLFCSVDTDQLTIPAGKYTLETSIGSYNGAAWVDLLIYNITKTADEEEFTDVAFSATGAVCHNAVLTTLILTETTVLEFRTRAGAGGIPSGEWISRIKIVKLR